MTVLDLPRDIDDPSEGGWFIDEVSFSWDEAALAKRSAAELFTQLIGHAPAVVLNARIPTVALPCRGYAAGEGTGVVCEVSLHGHDHDARIRLRRRRDILPWDLVARVTRGLDDSRFAGLVSRRIEMEMKCAAGSAPVERLLGSAARDAATVSRSYGDTRRQELEKPMAGHLSLERHVLFDSDQSAGREVTVRAAATVRDYADRPGRTLPWAQLLDRAIRAVDA